MTGSGRGGRGARTDDREQGNALVEFAIVVPLLLLLVFGIIEWGVFLNRKIDLTQGVREAGRQGAVALVRGRRRVRAQAVRRPTSSCAWRTTASA